jgi:hypothetical protein
MAPPSQPDPAVSQMFGRQLRRWQEALERWKKKCTPIQQEHRTLKATRGLVSDAPRAGGPDALKPEVAERLRELEPRVAACDDAIRKIEQTIKDLKEAVKSGVLRTGDHFTVPIRDKPEFLGHIVGRISRGDKLTVLELKGDWWRVRTQSGVEGWTQRSEALPSLPIELTSQPGRGKVEITTDEESRMGGAGRG